jgi:CDP-6-deoxy-D-xylo-4-hexulose-3-dehydrase
VVGPNAWKRYPHADHVHFFGFYIGNYPSLKSDQIRELCELLNGLATQ